MCSCYIQQDLSKFQLIKKAVERIMRGFLLWIEDEIKIAVEEPK